MESKLPNEGKITVDVVVVNGIQSTNKNVRWGGFYFLIRRGGWDCTSKQFTLLLNLSTENMPLPCESGCARISCGPKF